MSSSQEEKSGKFSISTFAVALFVTFCLLAIGFSGYVKYKLDLSETLLASPDMAFTPDQELYEKTVLALGYSGFLSATQNFMNTRDRAALGDMRMHYKTAQEAIDRLAAKAPTSVRRDLTAIMDIFASLVTKAEETDALSSGITSMDLLNAATSLSTLDARMRSAIASNRMEAHAGVKTWGLALMMITWSSLALLACYSIVVHVSRRKKSQNLVEASQSLVQSIKNLTQGDLENSIWGRERQDVVGEIARAIEETRVSFSQMPDVSIHTDQGMTRFRFEGESKSNFQKLVDHMIQTFDKTQISTQSFADSMSSQQDMVASLVMRLDEALKHIEENGLDQQETLGDLANSIQNTANVLARTQEANSEQIGSIIPYMKERAQNMAEVTHLAGKQVTQSLQSLLKAESTLRDNAAQSQKVVQQLANATNQMGERMFAALNLLQASGKHLSDTTDTVRSHFGEAVETLGRGERSLQGIIDRAESRLINTEEAEKNMAALAARTQSSAEKMERAVNNICDRHEGLSEQVVTATHRMEAIVASFDSAQRAMSEATSQVRKDGNLINSLLTELRVNNDQLLSSIHQNSQTNYSSAQSLAEKSHALMQRLEIQIQQQAQSAEAHIEDIAAHGKIMAQQAAATTSTLSQTITSLKGEQEKLAVARNRFSDTITDLGTRFEQQATTTFGKTEQWAAQSYTKLTDIAEQVENFMQRLGMLSQLTGTLGTVAGQLGQLVPTLTQLQSSGMVSASGAPMPVIDMEPTKQLIMSQTEGVMNALHSQWHEAVVQIEAMNDQLAQLVIQQKDQLETRLVVMDKKLREATEVLSSPSTDTDNDEKQADIMNEIITAISKINEHVMEIDEVIDDAGLRKEAS